MAAVRVFVFVLMMGSASAWADSVTLAGLTFSDELGGFRLLSASGSGTPEDPFVVVEEVTAPEQTVLTIRGSLEAWPGRLAHNRIGSDHPFGYALRKVVINRTDSVWTGYDVELQQPLGQASTQDDGLSFGEGSAFQRYAHADLFRVARVVQKPLDSIAFSVGDVPPGGRIALDFVVTDIQERPAIFVAQRRPWMVSGR
ncbi:hypothetical protein [Azospirillum sp.]|uniref:hypothetical protein n=1 Tax=Azospirillum sp. TaxID=34012 RepID=UPI003D760236